MTREDMLARLATQANDLDLWQAIISHDARTNRRRDPAARQPTKTVKIGVDPCQWPHLIDAARIGVCTWHKAPNPGSKMLRGIVAIYPVAPSVPSPTLPQPAEEQADAEE